ncbi:hypothetical protein G9A89_017380 [Geosiphon pyriformis]|nr:hypothetical protein G9A89_017380 [Geosiphon pyriformis]
MATLPIEMNIETIPFEEIIIGDYKDILQRRLGTILDLLVKAQIIAFKKIKQFQEKLKKKKTYKTLFLSVGDLVLEYCSDKDNIYDDKFSSQWKGPFIVNKVLNNGFYILQDQYGTIFNDHSIHDTQLKKYHKRPDWLPVVIFLIDMNNYFLDQNIQNTFYTLHEYWIKNYPNATLTIGKQTTITDNSGTYTVIRPKKTTTRREKISSKIDKYLLESITAAILTLSMTIGKTIKEILPINKNLSYGRQLELYGRLSEIIEEIKLMKKTTSEIQVEILGIIRLDVPRILTIARRAKTLIQRFGLLDTKLISPQVLYTLSTKDFNKLVSFDLVQYGSNDNDFNSDSNSDSNFKQYIMLPDFNKKQKLKWFSDNNEGIMPECMHDINAEFDLRYPGKKAIKLEPYLHTYINLKLALEILVTTIVQLASRSSLAKRRINIKERIIDTGYVKNIIVILQNNSEKAYTIEPNKKIAQAIFLPLIKIAQLVSVGNRKELRITARRIQGFRLTGRIDIPVNIAEEEIIDKREIISICQAISILLYDQYMLAIKKEVKDQA